MGKFAAQSDYGAVSEDVLFEAGTSVMRQCVPIAITDDALLETTESFLLSLTSSVPRVVLGTSSGFVIIRDDDGRLIDKRLCVYLSVKLWGGNPGCIECL